MNELDPSFMYTQILKEILLTIKFEQHHITEFIEFLCEQFDENAPELRKIKNFEDKYHTETPVCGTLVKVFYTQC